MSDILEKYDGQRVLVTGGAGFIGSHLVEKLLDLGARVSVIDTMLCGNKIEHLEGHKNLSIHRLDVTDIQAIEPLFEGQDMVFHLAAVVGVEETQDEPVNLLNVEVGGTSNVISLTAKNKVKRFIFASSSEVYGDSLKPMVEEGPFNPKSTYALTKLMGEHFCQAYYQKYGLEYAALRYFNVYGPRQDDRFVLSRFVSRALKGEEIRVYGDGNQTRDFTFIDDSARMSLLTGVTDGGVNQVLNFGTGRDVSINYLADLVLTRLNLSGKVNIRHVDYDHRRTREIEVFNRVANVDKAEKLLKYRPLTVLSDGLDKYITWYKGGA
ncbi:MAG: NAD-dependent epimerase/dehydratase family protein [Chloroflexi bacterium]|nr:NAD-dependent epimerase/dehydratase family protein [Chloroflexota bacterium]